MSPPVPKSLALDEALLALEGAAAALPLPPPARVLLARHADFWRFRTAAVPDLQPWDAVFPLGTLTPNGRHLTALLLEAAVRSPSLESAAVHALRTSAAATPSRAAGGVFVGVARRFERLLPVAVLRGERSRCEAVLRVFAKECGVAISVGGAVETPAQSAQTAQRLDVAALNAQEKTLRKQMRLMEAVRAANAVIATGSDLGP